MVGVVQMGPARAGGDARKRRCADRVDEQRQKNMPEGLLPTSKGLLPWNYEDIADTEFPGKGALEQVFDLR